MRKLKLQTRISVDGFIAGPNGEIDWMFIGAGQQPVIDMADTCDTILLSRKMGQEFIDHWEKLSNQPDSPELPLAKRMVSLRKIVFSRTQNTIMGNNAEITNADLAETVNALKEEDGKDMVVYGGADFVSNLIEHNLIDEYHLFVIPIALGDGLRIFKNKTPLKLIQSSSYKGMLTMNTYIPG